LRDKVRCLSSYDNCYNLLVNRSTNVQWMSECIPIIKEAFTRVCEDGVLTSSPLNGVIFYIEDAVFHGDAIHRGTG
jgi:translation elongation factor EF-G